MLFDRMFDELSRVDDLATKNTRRHKKKKSGEGRVLEVARVMNSFLSNEFSYVLFCGFSCFSWPVSLRSGSQEFGAWRDSLPRPLRGRFMI